jgi:hypothetical protein
LLEWQGLNTTFSFLLAEMGSLELFCLGWPQNSVFRIFASQVARIKGMSHCAWFSSSSMPIYSYLKF